MQRYRETGNHVSRSGQGRHRFYTRKYEKSQQNRTEPEFRRGT
jgi:hypothetical protein